MMRMMRTIYKLLPTSYQARARLWRMMRTIYKALPTSYQARVRDYYSRVRRLHNLFVVRRGFVQYQEWKGDREVGALAGTAYANRLVGSSNPLQTYLDSHIEGRGIWKWKHYSEIHHRHFSKFIGQEVHVLEIGVHSGGSLTMWKEYFGPKCRIYGVDIHEACKVYGDDSVKIFVGDQADRNFWTLFKKEVPFLDIIIDDGGHLLHQQTVTLEELLPRLRSGGVYVCEDLVGDDNPFAAYISGLSYNLNTARSEPDMNGHDSRLATVPTHFQRSVHSVHVYPFVAVIEKTESPVSEFVAPARGTQWQPFDL
jgi:hypothetical protein